ncbi:MAG TPA: TRAP transporter TatT component family protein [Myxococcales bacterium]|nr:TRAP transporter TatT component family protein [Myxococcales bacterium]
MVQHPAGQAPLIRPLLCLGGLCALLAGCAARPERAPGSTAVLRGELPFDDATLRQQARAHWQRRGERPELEAAIAAWEQVALRNPSDAETRVSLARAIHLLVDGYVRDEGDAARAVAMVERGAAYGLEALLAASPALQARVAAGTAPEDALELVDVRLVPALYWHALSLRTSADIRGPGAVVENAARIRRMMQRCLELDEPYYFGGPRRYMATFYARAPWIGGGDLEKSKESFQRAVELAPAFKLTRVYRAEFYEVKMDDRAGFQRDLEEVVSQPDGDDPELAPENALATKRARELLARKAELFP